MWGIHFFRYVGWDVAFFSVPLALNGPHVNDFTIILLASEMQRKTLTLYYSVYLYLFGSWSR